MWLIALKTLVADRGKLAAALVGVVFSVVLINVQGGLFFGLLRRASLLVDFAEADIWIGHKHMHNVDFPRDIPSHWVYRVRGVEGVAAAQPYIIGHSIMTLPSGAFEDVVVVGSDRASLLGNAWRMTEGEPRAVRQPNSVIVDKFELAKLEFPKIGESREIGGRRARIVAFSQGIVGFLVTPYVFAADDEAAAYLRMPPRTCSYLLVQLEPGADAAKVRDRIREVLPQAESLTSAEYAGRSINYWMTRTGLGISFGAATLLGLLVGLVIVAQTLYASVLDRLSEFGALKAMGARERQIFQVLFVQAVVIALAGSLMGLSLVTFVQRALSTPHAPIVIQSWLSLGSCGLVLAICLVSSAVPYLRIRKLDPMIVLQA